MKKTKFLFLIVWASFMLCSSPNLWANTNNDDERTIEVTPDEEEPAAEKSNTRKKKNTKAARHSKAVRIYPDILKREMHVVAKKGNDQTVDFFVFDTAGTLVQQYKMNEKDHKRIAGLKPGSYIYRVFTGDTETDFGTFEIK